MNIVHIAWLSGHNYGDDLMANALWGELRRRFTSTDIIVWCQDKPSRMQGARWIYQGVSALGPLRSIKEGLVLKKADMLVVGGGSVLHSENSVTWKLAGIRRFKTLHPQNPALGVSLSIGPFASKEGERLCVELLKSLDGCALRDRASYEFAQNLNLPYKPIFAADLAGMFVKNLGLAKKPEAKQIKKVALVFAVPDPKHRNRLFGVYGDILRGAVAQYEHVTLFLAARPQGRKDFVFAERLIERCMLKGRVTIVEYADDPVAFTKQLNEHDYIISSRLHGVVVGYFLGIPVTIISYGNKFEDFAESVGIPPERRFKESDVSAEGVLKSINYYGYKDVEATFERSKRNFEIFNEKR